MLVDETNHFYGLQNVYIDFETRSEIDLLTCGVRRYCEGEDFDILWISIGYYKEDDTGEEKAIVETYDVQQIRDTPIWLDIQDLFDDEDVIKHAWNAQFERVCWEFYAGVKQNIKAWQCTMVKSYYCGLPGSLDECGKVLNVEKAKETKEGKELIKFFSVPQKITKKNTDTWFNEEHNPVKWAAYGRYNNRDVEAEMEIEAILSRFPLPYAEQRLYIVDQIINERGIEVDLLFAINAHDMAESDKEKRKQKLSELSGIEKMGSPNQIKDWLASYGITKLPTNKKTGKPSLDKDSVKELLTDTTLPDIVRTVLLGRQQLGKSSNAKYLAMQNCASSDSRIRGMYQFYGANRTGRWAGRLVQLHNLPQNHIKELDLARGLVYDFNGSTDAMEFIFGDTPSILSQLIRTAFVAAEGKTFCVADYSAIEARVTAWLANEEWRLDVFRTHGKIYEASASAMFHIPIEEVTKGSDWRSKGKIAELALGFGGSKKALLNFGADKMGISDQEQITIVKNWRKASPKICELWAALEEAAGNAIHVPGETFEVKMEGRNPCIYYVVRDKWLICGLPSKRELFYFKPHFAQGKYGTAIHYWGNNDAGIYVPIDTWGGKLCENVVQATARDLLREAMFKFENEHIPIVLHTHDEGCAEVWENESKYMLRRMIEIMSEPISWAGGLPLGADGYITKYYKKDD